jgi:hypothetical protein
MRLCVLIVALTVAAGRAEAGLCDEDNARATVVSLEKFAASKQTDPPPEIWGLCMDQQVEHDAALTKRFLAACDKIAARDPKDAPCVRWSIVLGAKKLGGVDLFDETSKLFGLDPWKDGTLGMLLLAKLDDPRGVPLVKAAWEANAKQKHAAAKRGNDSYLWSVWRHAALKLLASQGTADDATFLSALPATGDASVTKAIHRAVAAIKKRAP